jgi:hypothetical protein
MTQAQEIDTTSHSRFSIFAGLSLPTGKFASTKVKGAGSAKAGFGGGLEFSYELAKSFDIGILCDISMNSIDIAELESMWRTYFSDNADNPDQVSVETSQWLTFDMMGSLGFNTRISPIVKLYGKAYAGSLFGIYPKMEMTITTDISDTYLLIQEEDNAFTVGYGFSCGLIIKDRIDFGLLFTSGEPEYRHKLYIEGFPEDFSYMTVKKPSSKFILRVGLILF